MTVKSLYVVKNHYKSKQKPHILIVENSLEERVALRRMLVNFGYTVTDTSSGRDPQWFPKTEVLFCNL